MVTADAIRMLAARKSGPKDLDMEQRQARLAGQHLYLLIILMRVWWALNYRWETILLRKKVKSGNLSDSALPAHTRD